MAKQITVSKEGFEKLQAELEHLKAVKRKEVALAIQKARAFGDLSENSEYDEAKNEQAEVEHRIAQLEETLANAIIMSDSELSTDKVGIGNRINVYCIDTEDEEEYKIVATTEADPVEGLISDECPLGKALIGSKRGDTVSVETPSGLLRYTVNKISK